MPAVARAFFTVASRLGLFLTDALLLTQCAGVVAVVLWRAGVQADAVGFVILGGGAAGFVSCFILFIPYALLYGWKAPRDYWRSLHPLNAGLAMTMMAAGGWRFAQPLSDNTVIAYSIGGLVAVIGGRFFIARPSLLLAVCVLWLLAAVSLGDWGWTFRLSLIGGGGAFLLLLPLRLAIRRAAILRADKGAYKI